MARQLLMGSQFPCYLLADSPEGRRKEIELTEEADLDSNVPTSRDIKKGFVYDRSRRITLGSISRNPDITEGMPREAIADSISRHAETEFLYDRPYVDNKKVRVAGPFTVESLSPHRAVSLDIEQPESEKAAERHPQTSPFEQTIIDNLAKAGVQNGRKAERLEFESLVPFAGTLIQAEGIQRNTDQRVAVSIGPQYGTVGIDWLKEVQREASKAGGFGQLVVLAFAFDSQANSWAEEFTRLPILLVRMNADLAMGESLLKKTRTGNLFMVFGAPDVHIQKIPDGQITVEIFGVDVYNPTTGEIRSDTTDGIAMWMVDTDYNEEAFFVRHCYFTGGNDPYTRLKKALKADIDEDAWVSLYSTKSRPFSRPDTGKIAVKVINHYGDEVLKVYDV
ncbi:MAG: hypothetical protein H0V92_02770 [Pseudonocardiales bacterium]|nr:hypothetical protein [Pseudonocardiales bacterium]